MLGYSSEELCDGMGSISLDMEYSFERMKLIEEEKHGQFETFYKTKSNKIIPVEVTVNFFLQNEEQYKIIVVKDLSLLKQSEKTIHDLVENIYGFVFILEFNLNKKAEKFSYISETSADFLGINTKELKEDISLFYTKIDPDDFEHYQYALRQSLMTLFPLNVVLRITHPIRGQIWMEINAKPQIQSDGMTLWYGICIDKSDFYQMQEELVIREKQFRTLVESLPDNILRYDRECRAIYVSPAIERIGGKDAVNMLMGKTPMEAHFLEDDTQAMMYQTKLKHTIETGERDEMELTTTMHHGSDMQIHLVRFIPELDTNGMIYGALAIGSDITERKATEKKIEHLAHHDPLIGLPNRFFAKKLAENAIQKAKDNKTMVALLYIDLDGFKAINDTLGHTIGDGVLRIVAERIRESLEEKDTLCRQGGDEFLVLVPNVVSLQEIKKISRKILDIFEYAVDVKDHLLTSSASIGVAIYPDHGDNYDSLLKNADMAMYQAKNNGKNSYSFYSQQLNHYIIGQFKLQNDIKSALNQGEFILHYQPQIDLSTQQVIGAEALIRWNHPQLGLISPMNFIPIAESSGLIVPIGEWVITRACLQAERWHAKGLNISVAVNISSVQFKRGNLEKIIKEVLYDTGINPKYFELELTESILIHDTEKTLQTVRNLKALGIQLSIDDFGTGYSSLAYLKRFAVDKLKIDQSFVRDIIQDHEDAIIVKTIIQMAKNLNLKTIAEGVESQEILSILELLGCDEVQGYYFAKPMEALAFENYIDIF